MHHLTGVDVHNTTAVAVYYETHAIPQRLNAGIICASILVSILGSYSSLFLLGKRTSNSGTRNIVLLILAATTMAFVGIWSMHFIGMYMRLEATMHISWYIRYNPGFAVFSLIAPAIALIVSFLFLDHDADGFRLWKVSLAGTLTGCTVALMHYSASFYCNFHVTFAPAQVVGSILLACVLCIVGFTAFFKFRYQWQDSWWKRGLCAIVVGLGVAGMHYVGVSGTEYRVKWNQLNGSDLTTGKRRNLILVCVIAVICFLVLLAIAIAAIMDVTVKRNSRKKARTLVVASATFDRNGRLMVSGDGTLPLTTVQERTLRRSQVLQALDQRSSVFHWLYAVSWDWNIVTPFLDAISSRIFDAEKKIYIANQRDMLTRIQKARRVFAKGSTDTTHDASQSQTGLLDFRDKVVVAAYRLSQDLEVALPELGIFYDYILPTGTRKAAEKALAKDPFPNQQRSGSISSTRPDFDEELRVGNRPESIFGKGEDEQEGVTMFIVREVEQDEVNQLAKRGYRFTETRFLSNILADRHGVLKEEMETTLEALRLYAKRGTKPIVQPGGYYAGLFCVRPSSLHQNDSLDVLVYDFARHQIPAFRLPQVKGLTAEIVFFLKSLDQVPMERVLQLCQQDSTHLLEQKKRIAKLLEFNVKVADKVQLEEEQVAVDALVQFQQNLYSAIKTLHQTMYFLPDLLRTSRFSSKMVELPSSLIDSDAAPAHMVLVQAILPAADRQTKRTQDIEHSTPYMFTPYNLFAKTQMMMLGGPPAEEFERDVVNELERRYKLQESSVEMSEEKTPTGEEEAKEVDIMSEVSRSSRPNTHVLTFNRAGPPSAIGTHRLSILEEQSVPSASSPSASAYGEGFVRKSPSQVLDERRMPRSSKGGNSVGQVAESSTANTQVDRKADNLEGTQLDDSGSSSSSSEGEVEIMSALHQVMSMPLSSPRSNRTGMQQSPKPSSSGSRSPRKKRSLVSLTSASAQQVAAAAAAQLSTTEQESPDICTIQVTSDQWQTQQLEELKRGQPDLMSGITPSEC